MPPQDIAPGSRAAALEAVVEIAVWQGDYAMVRPLVEQALARYRELGDATGIAVQLQSLGYSLSVIDPQAAREVFAESIEAFLAAGSRPMLGGSYVGKGVAELHLRLLDDAVNTLAEAESAFREAGEDDFRLIPFACLAWQLGFTEIMSARGGAMSRRSARHMARISSSGSTWR